MENCAPGAVLPWWSDRCCRSASCGSLLGMAQSGRFGLGVRVLAVLAREPGAMRTSAAIAEELGESAVMVRRTFLLLQKAGLISQRKGPSGGAKLELPPKEIGLGDVYAASHENWMTMGDDAAALDPLLKRVRKDAIAAMNETTLAQVAKRLRKPQQS